MTDNSEHQDQQNNSDDKPSSLGLSISTNSAILGFFALLCTAIIASTYLGTEEQIDKQKRQAQLKAL